MNDKYGINNEFVQSLLGNTRNESLLFAMASLGGVMDGLEELSPTAIAALQRVWDEIERQHKEKEMLLSSLRAILVVNMDGCVRVQWVEDLDMREVVDDPEFLVGVLT